jgi:hypothetical protein
MTDHQLIDRRRLAYAGPARRRQRAQAAGRRPSNGQDRTGNRSCNMRRPAPIARTATVRCRQPPCSLTQTARTGLPAANLPTKPADNGGYGRLR